MAASMNEAILPSLSGIEAALSSRIAPGLGSRLDQPPNNDRYQRN